MLDIEKIPLALRERRFDRRLFLAYSSALASIPLVGQRAVAQGPTKPRFASNPFTLGVASGDPSPSGMVLWTRLAPKPLEADGGMPHEPIEVAWEIASDDAMKNVVARGMEIAVPQLGHSVHAEPEGLAPDRWYWYRFRAGDAESPIGRTRTMPSASSLPEKLRFAFASCQRYEQGLYTAYEHMAKEDLDLVFHLGDYIYEYETEKGKVREVVGKEIQSLSDYRVRHAQYKSDPLLQAMHAQCPWIVTWDDHEVDNNYANDVSEQVDVRGADFLIRRANAYQAYYEAMPLRRRSVPHGPNLQLYRNMSFGRLAEFLVLDTRQFRTDQPNGDGQHDLNDDAFSPRGTILGPRQREWIEASLLESPANWNVLAQQIMMAMIDLDPQPAKGYYMDGWCGYANDRRQVLEFLRDRQVVNPVVITGDIHAHWAADLRVDDRRQEEPIVASEFIGTSISSGGDGEREPEGHSATMADNPHVKFFNHERGYVSCTVTPKEWRTDYRCVEYVSRPGAPLVTRASFIVESGKPGVQPA